MQEEKKIENIIIYQKFIAGFFLSPRRRECKVKNKWIRGYVERAKGKTFTTAQIYICMLNRSLRNPRKGKNKKAVVTSSCERVGERWRNGYVRTSSRFFSKSGRKKIRKIKGLVCVREIFRLKCGIPSDCVLRRATSDGASTCRDLSYESVFINSPSSSLIIDNHERASETMMNQALL